jgi:single-strand DNA-binding protein
MPTPTTAPPGAAPGNLAVLRGEVAAAPTTRRLPSGVDVVGFDVATPVTDEGSGSVVRVPVAWLEPPARAVRALRPGVTVVVVGTVRRRFFRAGGVTQSRTEVVAAHVVPARRRAAVAALLADVAHTVDALAAGR